MTKSNHTTLPIFLGLILVLGSFAPVVQHAMLQGNAFLFQNLEPVFPGREFRDLNFVNLILGAVFLVLFYFSKNPFFTLIWACISLFFVHNFIVNIYPDYTDGDVEPHYLPFMIAGLVSGLILLIVGLLNQITRKVRMQTGRKPR